MVKNPPADAGDVGSNPESGCSLGGRNGNPLQYSCLKLCGQRSLAGYSPWCCKESGTTEQPSNTRTFLAPWPRPLLIHEARSLLEGYFDTGMKKGGADDKESACQYKRRGFNPWVGKIPWRRKWQPAPAFLPGESHGQRSLVGYSPRGHKKLDTTEHTHKEMKKRCTNTQPLRSEKATTTSKNLAEK